MIVRGGEIVVRAREHPISTRGLIRSAGFALQKHVYKLRATTTNNNDKKKVGKKKNTVLFSKR